MLCILIDLFLLYFLFPLSRNTEFFVTSEKHRNKISFRTQCCKVLRCRFRLIFTPAYHPVVCIKHLSKLWVFLSGYACCREKTRALQERIYLGLFFTSSFLRVPRPEYSFFLFSGCLKFYDCVGHKFHEQHVEKVNIVQNVEFLSTEPNERKKLTKFIIIWYTNANRRQIYNSFVKTWKKKIEIRVS